jgi:uncharacterized coiled-coil protein SlyX
MLILRKRELQLLQITNLQQETASLREIIRLKNELVGMQQNKISDLQRENRLLTSKLDNMQERQQGSVVSYG